MNRFYFTIVCLTALSSTMASDSSSWMGDDRPNFQDNASGKLALKEANIAYSIDRNAKKYPLKEYSDIRYEELPETCWDDLQGLLTDLIENTIKDPAYEERHFSYTVLSQDYLKWYDWHDAISDQYCHFPISISFQGIERLSDRKENGYHDSIKGITIRNYAIKIEKSQKCEDYRIYEGKINERTINSDTFHSFMVRINFRPEELDKGKHNAKEQRPIFVKPELLKSKNVDQAAIEVKRLVFSNLEKAVEPFVVLVFNLHEESAFTADALLTHEIFKDFEREFEPRALIYDNEERRLYICYNNLLRKTIDLHGLTPSEAKGRVSSYIEAKHEISDSKAKIISGRGNHANANGSKGLINQQLPQWVDTIDSCELSRQRSPGIYNVEVEKFKAYVPNAADNLPNWFQSMGLTSSIRSCESNLDEPGSTVVELKLSKYDLNGPRITFYNDNTPDIAEVISLKNLKVNNQPQRVKVVAKGKKQNQAPQSRQIINNQPNQTTNNQPRQIANNQPKQTTNNQLKQTINSQPKQVANNQPKKTTKSVNAKKKNELVWKIKKADEEK